MTTNESPEPLTLGHLHEEYVRVGEPRFLSRRDAPFLVAAQALGRSSGATPFQTVTGSGRGGGLVTPRLEGATLVWEVRKRQTTFPDKITIGRTPNNDVVIPDDGISKFHAYIAASASRWRIVDAGSSNGTRVSDRATEALDPTDLIDGTVITLGAAMQLLWCPPPMMVQLLNSSFPRP
jgi:hypothetical protein